MTKIIDLESIPNIDWVKGEIEARQKGIAIEQAGDNGGSFVLRLRRLSQKHEDVELPYEWLGDLGGKYREHRVSQIRQRLNDAVNSLA